MMVAAAFISNTLFNFVIGLLLARFLGPEEYGRFAVGVAVAVMIQTIVFDWTRLSAARFYSARVRTEEPGLRSTLDASLVVLIAGLVVVAAVVAALPVELPLPKTLLMLAVAVAIANGVFDLHAAFLRARFVDRTYARLVVGKNLLSLVVTVGGAAWLVSAPVALVGVVISMVGSLFGVRRQLSDPGTRTSFAQSKLAKSLIRYAAPIVLANLFYQSIPLLDRLVIAHREGFAASGQFSFAYDVGLRTVSAIGTMLDVILFQVAVRADELHGSEQAKKQIGENIGMVLAVLAPACAGCWLVLPSFEAIVAPADYEGAFGAFFARLLPGLFCYGLITFAMQPMFLIRKTTVPLVGVAIVASLANALWIGFWDAAIDPLRMASGISATWAGALVLLALAALPTRPAWPRGRDVLATLLATGLMVLAVRALPAGPPSVLRLAEQAGLGVLVYGVTAYLTDLCQMRDRIQPLYSRFTK